MADAMDASILSVDTKAVLKLIRDLELQLSEYHRCVGIFTASSMTRARRAVGMLRMTLGY
jgi:hypothetical protein